MTTTVRNFMSVKPGIACATDHTLPSWICVQSGHREQYGIPRALERAGHLEKLIADAWVERDWRARLIANIPRVRRLSDRFHPEIPTRKVEAHTLSYLLVELMAMLRTRSAPERIHIRRKWWADKTAQQFRNKINASVGYVFSYSYEALPIFREARRRQITPVLGQIDPGPEEDKKVAQVAALWPQYKTSFVQGAAGYYAEWRQECELAEHIVVNSEWSRYALIKAGIPAAKLFVLPLIHAQSVEAASYERYYPIQFTSSRPMRLLFLGQCILRKGIAEIIEAAKVLVRESVEFIFVGNTDIADFTSHFGEARIQYFPRVTRTECHEFYRNADVFLFPTHSDGFGLTQLEAQAWKLPIIASEFCAQVVLDKQTGVVLEEVSAGNLVKVIKEMLRNPAELALYSGNIKPHSFGLDELGRALTQLGKGDSMR